MRLLKVMIFLFSLFILFSCGKEAEEESITDNNQELIEEVHLVSDVKLTLENNEFVNELNSGIKVDNNGKILVWGVEEENEEKAIFIKRYIIESSGTKLRPDLNFGVNGVIRRITYNGLEDLLNLEIMNDNSLVLLGRHRPNGVSYTDILVGRFDSDGKVNDSNAGFEIVDLDDKWRLSIRSVKLDNSGKVLVAGWHNETSSNGDNKFKPYIARVNKDNTLDYDFANNGYYEYISITKDYGQDLIVDEDAIYFLISDDDTESSSVVKLSLSGKFIEKTSNLPHKSYSLSKAGNDLYVVGYTCCSIIQPAVSKISKISFFPDTSFGVNGTATYNSIGRRASRLLVTNSKIGNGFVLREFTTSRPRRTFLRKIDENGVMNVNWKDNGIFSITTNNDYITGVSKYGDNALITGYLDKEINNSVFKRSFILNLSL